MEFKENKAIYLQIADRICDEVLTEKYRDEERIPSVREYSAEVEVNVNTVMRAYDYLQQQDVIFTKRGLGYYVAHGARTVIETIRRKEFFDVALSDLVRSMDTLGISIDEVVEKLHEMKKHYQQNKSRSMKQIVTMSVATMLLAASCTNVNVNNANDDFRDSHKWGKVIRQEVVVSDFTSIELSEDFDVVYRQSDEPSAFIEGNEKVVAYHHIEVANGVLVDHKTDDAPMNMPPVRLVVTSPHLNYIEVSGSGDIDVKDSIAADDFKLLLSGSGDIDIEGLICKSVDAVVSGSGDIKIDNVSCQGDAFFELAGSGDLNVDVICENVDVAVSGSGDVDLTVDCAQINATATGTGNMELKGVANVLNKRESGLASIDTKKLEVEQINLR